MPKLGTCLALVLLLSGCADSSALDELADADTSAEPDEPRDTTGRLTEFDDLSQDHVAGEYDYPDADVRPPAGGPHNAGWQNCGVYTEPIASEHAVHSLEHGAVWITYTPGLDPDQIADAEAAVGASGYVLVSPYDGQESPIVLSAWGVQLEVDDIGTEQVDEFLTTYVRGSQTPEPGAPCSGGTDALRDETERRPFA